MTKTLNFIQTLLFMIIVVAITLILFEVSANAEQKFLPYSQVTPLMKVIKPMSRIVRKTQDIKKINPVPIRIGIIDSGYNPEWANNKIPLCDDGHWSAMTGAEEVTFGHWHGSVVASTIAETANPQGVNYCAVIFHVEGPDGLQLEYILEALKRAKDLKLDAVNMSLGGTEYSYLERRRVYELQKSGTRVFIAAGNDTMNFNAACFVYPACYPTPNLQIVGAMDDASTMPTPYSNYGMRVKVWFPGGALRGSERVDGTSFASPRALASYIYSLALQRAGQ